MITHTVFFRLKHAKDSAAERKFLTEAAALANIPGVMDFEMLRQTSPKNDFDYGLSMKFANQAAYDAYNDNPFHIRFVNDLWVPEVAAFLEIDYVPLHQ